MLEKSRPPKSFKTKAPPTKSKAIQRIAFLIRFDKRTAKPGRKYHQPKNK
jgi:hypothetical protein